MIARCFFFMLPNPLPYSSHVRILGITLLALMHALISAFFDSWSPFQAQLPIRRPESREVGERGRGIILAFLLSLSAQLQSPS